MTTTNLKEAKKKVIEDWKSAFPQLTVIFGHKLFKIVGPLLVGIDLIRLMAEEYRPFFVLYSLWGGAMGTDLNACLAGPILFKPFYNKKNRQFDIPYSNHNNLFPEVLKTLKENVPVSLTGDISLKDILSVMDDYAKSSPLDAAPDSFLQAALQKNKLLMALYADPAAAQKILEKINNRNWNADHFKLCGHDVKEWLHSLPDKIHHRDAFLNIVESNKQDNKLNKLVRSELVR